MSNEPVKAQYESSMATFDTPRTIDEKGRVVVSQLTDREIMVEQLTLMRLVSDVLNAIGDNPMLSKMIPGQIGRAHV